MWTLKQAIRLGFLAGLAALVLWPVYALLQDRVRLAFVAALSLAAFCGASILCITVIDLLTVHRDRRIMPARIFDLALGATLAMPSALALASLLG